MAAKKSLFSGDWTTKRDQNVRIKSPAKINLFLHVTAKRSDGYHDLLSLMCCISLYDNITLSPSSCQGIGIRCMHASVPENHTNLAYRAAALFFRELGCDPAFPESGEKNGLRIKIEKNIPVAAGLGGGSSNAAAVLSALNSVYDHPFSMATLSNMGLSLGADVPFFLFGKPAIVAGIGEKLTDYAKLRHFTLMLVCPEFSVSTAAVYKKLNLRLTKCEKKLKKFLFGEPVFDIRQHLCNDLELVTTVLHPEILQIKQKLMDLNANGALMSGSGPAVFGVFTESDKARFAYDVLAENDNWRVFIAETLF